MLSKYDKKLINSWIESLVSDKDYIEKCELVEVKGKTQYRFTLKKP